MATSEASLASAKAQVEMRRAVRTSLAARLMEANAAPSAEPTCCVRVLAPASGRVLKIVQDSEATVLPGTPLVDIGNPLDLVVADLLSTDAVQIKPGAAVRIDGWGGQPIKGKVVRVDPAGFLKVSALGIEEQRVRVTIDFADPPEAWASLGHDYRVVRARDHLERSGRPDRAGKRFIPEGRPVGRFCRRERACQNRRSPVGHRNNRVAEVLSRLAAGDFVVLHPSDRVADGTRVAQRN